MPNALMQAYALGNDILDRRQAAEDRPALIAQRNALAQLDMQGKQSALATQEAQRVHLANQDAQIEQERNKAIVLAGVQQLSALEKDPVAFNHVADFYASHPVIQKLGIKRESITPESIRELRAQIETSQGAKPDEEKFGAAQDMVIGGKPSMAQVGSKGTVRPVADATPYNKPTAAGFGELKNTQEADVMAQMIARGELAMPTGRALLSPLGQYLAAKVKEINPEFSATTYPTKAAALKDFTSGMTSRKVRSLNTAIDHMDTLDELIVALDNNDTNALNRVLNFFSKETGDPKVTNFKAAKELVAKEVIAAVVQGGGGQAEREEASASFNAANSTEQLKQVVETYRHLLGGQMHSLNTQYEQGTGLKDFQRFLSPRTKKALNFGGEQPAQPTQQQAPAAAIAYLKAHPELAEQFKAKYGYLPDG